MVLEKDSSQKMPAEGGRLVRSSYPHNRQLGQEELRLEVKRMLEGQVRQVTMQRNRQEEEEEEEERAKKRTNKRRRPSQAPKKQKLYQKPIPEDKDDRKRHEQACLAHKNRQLKKQELSGLHKRVRTLELEAEAKAR